MKINSGNRIFGGSPKEKILHSHEKQPNGCWNWIKYTDKDGYGHVHINRVKNLAHRVSYEQFKGQIPSGNYVLHSCDNPSCVNPDHLFLGTQLDNMRDMFKKGRGNITGLRRGFDAARKESLKC